MKSRNRLFFVLAIYLVCVCAEAIRNLVQDAFQLRFLEILCVSFCATSMFVCAYGFVVVIWSSQIGFRLNDNTESHFV